MILHDAFITAAGRCAPPKNKPTPGQLANCFPFLVAELAALARTRVIVTLGKIADDTIHAYVRAHGRYLDPRTPFAHGRELRVALPQHGEVTVVASYHPSRQNTNTGVLTDVPAFAKRRLSKPARARYCTNCGPRESSPAKTS